jgi:hypothetical protein
LGFLPVADPLRAARFKQSLGVLELRAFLLQLEGCFLLDGRRPLDFGMALVESRNFLEQSGLGFDQRLAAAFLAIKRVERLKLDVEREQRLDALAQRVELGACRLDAFELTDNPVGVAVQCGFLFFGDRDLGEKLSGLFALPLRHLPARLDRHHLPLTYGSAMRCMMRTRLGLLSARRGFRQRAKHRFRIRHTALHAVDSRAHAIPFLTREVLGDAELFVAKNA